MRPPQLRIHARVGIIAMLQHWDLFAYEGMFLDQHGKPLPAEHARQQLAALYNSGHRLLAIDGCDNFDPVTEGCRGHVIKETTDEERQAQGEARGAPQGPGGRPVEG